MSQTNQERLVVLETKVDAIMQQLKALDQKIDAFNAGFVTNMKHSDDLKDIERSIALNGEKIQRLNKLRWVQNLLSGILGAVLSLLVAYFINNVGA